MQQAVFHYIVSSLVYGGWLVPPQNFISTAEFYFNRRRILFHFHGILFTAEEVYFDHGILFLPSNFILTPDEFY
jgi:hypothetical protein